jgi:glycolate oxidase FAD binding subunit
MSDLAARSPREPLVPPGGADLHVGDMTATFAADLPLRDVQIRLAGHGQWLPVDGDPDTPIGVLVETNSTGPLRLGYGAWRDLLLGVQFTNGSGELVTAGGRVVKNVAGYDLTKFMVGQFGVFGRLVTVTTRTYRRPDMAVLARFAPDGAILGRLLTTPLRPQWALLTPEALLLGYLGDESSAAYYESTLKQGLGNGGLRAVDVTRRSIEADIEHRAGLWKAHSPGGFRASVPPARLGEFVSRAGVRDWVADAAFGVVVGSAEDGEGARRVREAASGLGGGVTLFGGPGDGTNAASGRVPELSTSPAERRIIDRLKDAFDPDDRLAPLPWRKTPR